VEGKLLCEKWPIMTGINAQKGNTVHGQNTHKEYRKVFRRSQTESNEKLGWEQKLYKKILKT
jgi:hypothetical protein